MIWILLLISVGLAFWVYWRVKNHHLLACARRVPGPPTLPILGNAWEFLVPSEQILNVIGRFKKEYGNTFRFWLGPDLNFCVFQPDDVKFLLTSNKTTAKGPQYKYLEIYLGGDGILSGSGPVWRKRRKIISSTYATKRYNDVFHREVGCLMERLRTRESGGAFNVYEEVVKTTSYTVCQTLFGLSRAQTLALPHLQTIIDRTPRAYLELFMRMTTWYLQIEPIFMLLPYYTTSKEFKNKILAMSDAVVKHRLGTLQLDEDNMDASNNNDKCTEEQTYSAVDKLILTNAIPDYEELLKETFTIFTTSQEASAKITSWLLLMMAIHPECQKKLYAEIKCVLGDDANRDVSDDDLKQMPYLDMVFKEVIRLFPIGPLLQRTILDDIEIHGGVTLPAGSSLSVPIFHIHRDQQFWTRPDSFLPERFSPEECRRRHPGCYVPFSLGSMDCLGRLFATKLVKTISARVLRKYWLTSPETYEGIELVCAISMEAVHGYPVCLHPRAT